MIDPIPPVALLLQPPPASGRISQDAPPALGPFHLRPRPLTAG